MKLVSKFAVWYLTITTFVLLLGGIFVFRSVQQENDEEEVRRVRGLIEDAVASLEKGAQPDSLRSDKVDVRLLPMDKDVVAFQTIDTMAWHSHFQGTERQIKGTESFKIHGKHYLISARSFAPEPEETITGVIRSLSWIFLALLVIVGATSVLVSRRILFPFNASLRAIQTFNLKQKKPIDLPATRTEEFASLNAFLEKMTNKALQDYRALKEFTENASHELQTPLAIIRGKLELMLESDINDEQARLIMSAHEAVERLSRTNHALTLLTKLENEEYHSVEPLNLSDKLHKTIFALTELMEMKSLNLKTNVQENVYVNLHPALADILLLNLLSNAIRHNIENGSIEISLATDSLQILNTGPKPEVPTEQLFERFKKSNQSSDSIGLGLSIVKRICEASRFEISYRYEDSRHSVNIRFMSPAV